MKTVIDVIKVEVVEGTGKKGPYKFQKLHCIVRPENPAEDSIVGVLVTPKGLECPCKGSYEAEFGLTVDFDQRIIGTLKKLTPVKVAAVSPAGKASF